MRANGLPSGRPLFPPDRKSSYALDLLVFRWVAPFLMFVIAGVHAMLGRRKKFSAHFRFCSFSGFDKWCLDLGVTAGGRASLPDTR